MKQVSSDIAHVLKTPIQRAPVLLSQVCDKTRLDKDAPDPF